MQNLEPELTEKPGVCEEITTPPSGMVIFGASGDLVQQKLVVGLFCLFSDGLLPDEFYLIGCGRKEYDDETFRKITGSSIKKELPHTKSGQIRKFTEKLFYQPGDYSDRRFYVKIAERQAELDKTIRSAPVHIYYLAVPPFLYSTIVTMLGESGLAKPENIPHSSLPRLVVEKPFGRDYESARELNNTILNFFDESQVYRIDHYLGKETVQNILMFRFANTIFEPIWNRNFIDHIQITIAESVGIKNRAGYYEKTGAIRDMFQNHILQMLALVAMEPPVSFDADNVRDEKVKLLQAIRKLDSENLSKTLVRGQYSKGEINGEKVCGYRQEDDVAPDSTTETYAAMKMYIDNWRWEGVPFYLRAGKRLKTKDTEIAIFFKNVPHSMFFNAGLRDIPQNILVLQLQPAESISLSFQAKNPGAKLCMSTLKMNFDYHKIFKVSPADAYQRLLLDAMAGDQTLFTRFDAAEISWKLLSPVLNHIEKDNPAPILYPAGAESFKQADELIEKDARKWRNLDAE